MFISNVPWARALAPPKLDQRSLLRTVLPSPHVSVSVLGRLLALMQLVIFTGEAAEAHIATEEATTAASAPLLRRFLPRLMGVAIIALIEPSSEGQRSRDCEGN